MDLELKRKICERLTQIYLRVADNPTNPHPELGTRNGRILGTTVNEVADLIGDMTLSEIKSLLWYMGEWDAFDL